MTLRTTDDLQEKYNERVRRKKHFDKKRKANMDKAWSSRFGRIKYVKRSKNET